MSKTLLLADDSVTIQKVVGITFASEDVELVAVDNGDDALARAREIQPDLVLADASMPGLNGYELCAAIKADPSLRDTPVVLLTGTFEVHDEGRTAEVGADAQIAKPFEAQALVDLVRRLVGSGRAAASAPVQTAAPAAPTIEPPAVEAPPLEPEPAPEAPLAAEPEPEFLEGDAMAIEPPTPSPTPAAARPMDATVVAAAPPTDTDFSFSDLEFARNATGGPPPDATQVMGGPPVAQPLSSEAAEPLDLEPIPEEPIVAAPIVEQPIVAAPIVEQPIVAAPIVEEPIVEEPFSIDPIPEEPFGPEPMQTDVPTGGATRPSLPKPDDSLSASADGVPDIEPLSAPEPAGGEDLAYGRTTLMDPSAAQDLADCAEIIPEEPLAPAARAPGLLDADAGGVDDALDIEPIQSAPMEATPDETTGAIEVEPLGEQTGGGSEIFGDPLANTGQNTGLDTAAEPGEPSGQLDRPSVRPVPRKPAQAAPVALDADALQRSIEKVAWDAFGPLSEQLVREVVKKIEEIAWEVVPQMAERLVRDEIARLTEDDD